MKPRTYRRRNLATPPHPARLPSLPMLGVLGLAGLMAGCLGNDWIDGIGHGHHGSDGGAGGAAGGGQVGDACGGFAANVRPCAPGLVCDGPFPELACAPDVGGTCQVRPEVCDLIYAPVCGCDLKTYGNDCQRQAAGVSKLSNGACPSSGTGGATGSGGTAGGGGGNTGGGIGDACGGFIANARTCAKGLFCDGPFPDLACAPDVGGTCQPVPEVCSQLFAPVCGCDCKTYGNDCMRQAAGVSKRADGACSSTTGC